VGANAEDIERAARRVRAAGALLRQRPPEDVIDALGEVLDRFRDPESPVRVDLHDELPAATGFATQTVRAGLDLALSDWTGDALRALVRAELGSKALVRGFDLTAVLLGGALPMPTLLALLAPLALRSPVLAKTAHHDPVTARAFARELTRVDPALGACVEVFDFAGHDDACTEALLAAECVSATGSDETVAAIAGRVRPPRRFVGYGHRVSVAVLGPHAQGGAGLADAARGLALDVALWDQLGCLSPVSVYVVGPPASADAVATAIADELEALATRLPRGLVAREAAVAFAQALAEAEMRAAAGGGVRIHGGAERAFAVVQEPDARVRPAPLHRFLRVHPVADVEALLQALAPLARHLAGVALAGFDAQDSEVAASLVLRGASRVCRPGRLQAPPLAWHHDGLPVLLPLARFGDLEL
jgi:hypothetical protein